MNQPASAYFMEDRHDPNETHTLSVLVQNEPGVLARVIGLFSGRGYNIESLTVSETESQKHLSRITIVTTGTPQVIQQIKHQLDRMIPIYKVVDMTLTGTRSIERPDSVMSTTRYTGTMRSSWCLICSITIGVPVVTMVMRERCFWFSVSETVRLSML